MTGDLNEYNSAGLKSLSIAPLIAATIGEPYRMLLTEEVTLAGAVEWSETAFTEGTAVYAERMNRDNGDVSWDVVISLLRPKGEYEWLRQLQEGYLLKFVADVVDQDDQRRLVGTAEEGLSFDVSFDTKRWFGERKEESITLSGRFRQRPPFYAPAGSGS